MKIRKKEDYVLIKNKIRSIEV